VLCAEVPAGIERKPWLAKRAETFGQGIIQTKPATTSPPLILSVRQLTCCASAGGLSS